MSLSKATEYLNQVSGRFPLFRRIAENTYNFRCIFCGDSKKDQKKTRGYLYPNTGRDGLIYKCHNCGVSLPFGKVLKEIDSSLYRKYLFDIGFRPRHEEIPEVKRPKKKPDSKIAGFLSELPSIDRLESGHVAVKYLNGRRIPKSEYKYLRYIEDTSLLNDVFPEKEGKIRSNKGVIFPFMDWETGKIGGASTRILDGTNNFRYLTLRHQEYSDSLMVFHRGIDKSKPRYVVEGQFDSLFIPNSVAMGNSSLHMLNDPGFVYVFDNEPHNKEIRNLVKKTIDLGYSVVLWENGIVEKDINEMILSGIDVRWNIDSRTFQGIKARMLFNTWR